MNSSRCLSKWRTKSIKRSYLIEGLGEIFHEVVDVLDAGGNPHEAVGDTDSGPSIGGDRCVRHGGRMRDERFDTAEAFCQRVQAHRIQQPPRALQGAEVEGEHAAE